MKKPTTPPSNAATTAPARPSKAPNIIDRVVQTASKLMFANNKDAAEKLAVLYTVVAT